MKNILTLLLFSICSFNTYAQLYEVGVGAGVLHYKGDVTPRFKPFSVSPGGSLFFRYNLSRAVSLKANGLIGYFHGNDSDVDDPYYKKRDFKFKTSAKEFGLQIEYNFLNFRTNASRITSEWTPYVFGGVSYTLYSVLSTYKFKDFVLDNNGVATNVVYDHYLPFSSNAKKNIVIPFGIGFKKKWNDNWNWGVEFGSRKTFKDDLDNMLTYPYGVPTSQINDKLQQGLVETKDMYYYTNFSISYVFYKVHCPTRKF